MTEYLRLHQKHVKKFVQDTIKIRDIFLPDVRLHVEMAENNLIFNN